MSKRRTVQLRELGSVRVRGTTLAEMAAIEYLPGEEPVRVVDADIHHPAVVRFLASHVVEPVVTVEQLAALNDDALTRLFTAVLNARSQTRRILTSESRRHT